MISSEPRPGQGRDRKFHFGDFVLDVDGGFLRHAGVEVPLQPKAFEVLTYLAERQGRLVTKAELMDSVWPDTAITENSLSQCIVQIRRALADDSQQVIRTVARRGYLFAAPLTTPVLEFPRAADSRAGGGTPVAVPVRASLRWNRSASFKAGAVILAVAGAAVVYKALPPRKRYEPVYTQITNFSDSASGPVLSADGRIVAFFKGNSWFAATGPIYAKMLPNGDAVQITSDSRNKYGLAFSPDASKIAYTAFVAGGTSQWQTFTVPTLGGEPRLLLSNAAGLTWLDEQHLLYSEIRTGLHMGVVTSSPDRSNRRQIYFPEHERRMAHYSYPSPDRKWALLVEMEPRWLPCRIVPMDGSSAGRQAGPAGPCLSAGWSPDGQWMYFSASVNGATHLWRQRFPNGEPEQITFGPAEEEGIAIAPDGRSLITSVGIRGSAVWMHDSQGEHAVSVEGYASANYLLLSEPRFSKDGKLLYYLLRRESPGSGNELWRTNLVSKTSESLVRDFQILQFDISSDTASTPEVVFSSQRPGEASQLWLAPLDRSAPPKRIAASGEDSPHFGPDGTVWFRYSDGKANYIGRVRKDGSGRARLAPYPISTFHGASPDGRWLIALAPVSDRTAVDTIAIPYQDAGRPRKVCLGFCTVAWAPDGKTLYVGLSENPGRTLAIPVSAGEFPDLPVIAKGSGIQVKAPPGAWFVDRWEISPSPDPSTFAYVKMTDGNRNLFRVSLP